MNSFAKTEEAIESINLKEPLPTEDEAARLDLTHQFLIAMPSVDDSPFTGAVVFVCEHNEQGALGLVINRPMELTLGKLFKQLEMEHLAVTVDSDDQVFFGGPVSPGRGFVLHSPYGKYEASVRINEKLALTTSKDILQEVAVGKGPSKVMVTLGYSGWAPGQLEKELSQNVWLNVDAHSSILFDTPPDERFEAALALLGVDPIMLTLESGHA